MASTVKKLSLVFAAKSDIGLVRTENQDSFGKFPEDNTNLYNAKGQLFIVADGMGGHKGGKEASTIAVKVVSTEYLNSTFEESVAIKESIEKANYSIFNQAGDSTEFGRMGTTCSVLLLKNEKGIIGHVGDSRIYKIEQNKIEQLTNDHTKVQEMLREGILTPEEARNYPSKSVLARALGVDENVRVDIIDDITLKKGQSFILCSDGLAKVSKGEILPIVANNTPSDACKILVDLANDRGGKDNVTVIIVKIDPDYSVKVAEPEPVKKEVKQKPKTKTRTRIKGTGRGWLSVVIVLLIVFLLLLFKYKDSIFTSSSSGDQDSVSKIVPQIDTKIKKEEPPPPSSDKLLAKADELFKEGDYDNALILYKKILEDEPMHQAALKGVNEVASAYLSGANKFMGEKNFEEALKYYKKVEAIQPDNEIVKNRINLCASQISYKTPGIDSSVVEENPVEKGGQITTTRFDLPGWSYPGINKNEFTIKSYELDFTNTLTNKFIIYDKDLFKVTLAVSTVTDKQDSWAGLIIGYNSPSDYYIFKHQFGGDYILQRITEDDVNNLLVIKAGNSEKEGRNLLKIQYSDNLISIYNENGLLSSYKSVWGIFGKAGLYVDKNASVKFQNVFLSGKTKLN